MTSEYFGESCNWERQPDEQPPTEPREFAADEQWSDEQDERIELERDEEARLLAYKPGSHSHGFPF